MDYNEQKRQVEQNRREREREREREEGDNGVIDGEFQRRKMGENPIRRQQRKRKRQKEEERREKE
jgi:hypothetical protein